MMDESFEELLKRAQNGDAQAQQEVGMRYFYGMGVEQNRDIASQWFTKAAAQSMAGSVQTNAAAEPKQPTAREPQAPTHSATEPPVRVAQEPSPGSADKKTSKKKRLPGALISSLVLCVGIIALGISLVVTPGRVGTVIGIILILFGVAAPTFAIVSTYATKSRYICPNCKEQYDYDEDVSYESVGTETKSYSFHGDGSHGHQIKNRLYYNLRVSCDCHNCHARREHMRKILVGSEYWDGATETTDPDDTLRKEYSVSFYGGDAKTKKANIALYVLGGIFFAAALIVLGVHLFKNVAKKFDNLGYDQTIVGEYELYSLKVGTETVYVGEPGLTADMAELKLQSSFEFSLSYQSSTATGTWQYQGGEYTLVGRSGAELDMTYSNGRVTLEFPDDTYGTAYLTLVKS